jgi:putative transposase
MKAGSFTQLYVQIVFAVKYRKALLSPTIRPTIFSYMGGILSELGHKPIIINGFVDHVHVFIGLNPSMSLSDTVHRIKRSSSLFINKNRLCKVRFQWQVGYGAFSYSHSQISFVHKYIENQERHHSKLTFKDEYKEFLEKYEINYDERFLFNPPE